MRWCSQPGAYADRLPEASVDDLIGAGYVLHGHGLT